MRFRPLRRFMAKKRAGNSQAIPARTIMTWLKTQTIKNSDRSEPPGLSYKLQVRQARYTIAGAIATISLGIISAFLAWQSIQLTKKYGESKELINKQDTLIGLLINQNTLLQHQFGFDWRSN
jgi:hypothetical protein